MTQKNRPQNDCQVLSQEILDILQDPHLDANPELHYQQKDEYSRLAEALEQLPFNEKQVLIMRYYNDMKRLLPPWRSAAAASNATLPPDRNI